MCIRDSKRTITIINNDLKNKFRIRKPKILVTGLNPHAGEDGMLGMQDSEVIAPAITDMKKNKILVVVLK